MSADVRTAHPPRSAHLALVAEDGARMTTALALRVEKRRPGVTGGSDVGSGCPRKADSPAQRPPLAPPGVGKQHGSDADCQKACISCSNGGHHLAVGAGAVIVLDMQCTALRTDACALS